MLSPLLPTTTCNVPTASNASVTRPNGPRSPPFMTVVWRGRSGTHPPTLAGFESDALYHVLPSPVDSMQ
ncbi:hypothetical protein EXIGLDRAFT_723950 [Exidia glandulosa HHB12029]|uniref:Uncharacterized protein n=1 Tax=Exidia glandulosa HHB12029 TaxID=1314781 RepID=A0A165EMB5_EXIGL|nr:hypothetical protein EXIGLDRAFT_723950 [Exidia glandulosa HHB12029]